MRSVIKNQIYTGSTIDLRKRLDEHNSGKVVSTKIHLPWNLVYYEAFIEEKLARIREKNLKYNGNAMKELKKRIGLDLPSTTLTTKSNRFSEKVSQVSKNLELKKNRSGAGFTLIEILVVIGMIGVLTAGFLLVINPALQLKRSRDATRKSDIKQLQTAFEQYKSDNGTYPNFNGFYGWAYATSLTLNTPTVTYLQVIPKGVNTEGDSCKGYVVAVSATNYAIFTILENANDPDALAVKPAPPYVPAGGGSPDGTYKTFTWTAGTCPNYIYNFWVNNP